VSFCPKNIKTKKKEKSVFCPKNGPGYKSQGGKSRPGGGAKISPGGEAAPPTSCAYVFKLIIIIFFYGFECLSFDSHMAVSYGKK